MISRKSICSAAILFALYFALAAFLVSCAETVVLQTPPPSLPSYEQPVCPGPGFLWIPGYWANGPEGYYWVPGMWEMAPQPGLLWTPGYWSLTGGEYVWHAGYWGNHIGYYGGIDYGYGYDGVGYSGGYWKDDEFYYNTEVTRVNLSATNNTYQAPAAAKRANVPAVSCNGGNGGTTPSPTEEERAASRETHIAATPSQQQHVRAASGNRELLASANRGQPRSELLVKRFVPIPPKPKVVKAKPKPAPKPLDKKQDQKKPADQEK